MILYLFISISISLSKSETSLVNSFFLENKASDCDIWKLVINQEFMKCNKDTVNYWKKVDNIKKQNCCSYYDHFDCRISSAKRLCDLSAFDKFHEKEVKKVKDHEKLCYDYSRKSCKSHFPVWLIILIIFLVVGFIVVIVFFVIRMRK